MDTPATHTRAAVRGKPGQLRSIHQVGATRAAWRAAALTTTALAALVFGVGCDGSSASGFQEHPAFLTGAGVPDETPQGFEVPPPPFSDGIFPCSDCHDPDLPVNARRRELTVHQEVVLQHDEQHRWCLDCHDKADRDSLHLAGGELVPFDASYRLCGQCHGDKYRDWRAGVHGRRTGMWNGKKQYMLCVHCHNAHAPAFGPLKPEPAPRAPVRTP